MSVSACAVDCDLRKGCAEAPSRHLRGFWVHNVWPAPERRT
jgi:hypothetical protein